MSSSEVVTRANGGTYFAIIEPARGPISTETFRQLKDVMLWLLNELDYYISNDSVKEIKEITDDGAAAVLELSGDLEVSLTLFKSDARPNLQLKKED